MLRLETQSRIKKVTRRNSDNYFPHSSNLVKYAKAKTLPWPDVYHTDSTFQCIKNLTYGRIRHSKSHSEGSIAELVAQPLVKTTDNPDDDNDHQVREQRVEELKNNADFNVGSHRSFQAEESWKSLTLAEIDTEFGFTQICPQGLDMAKIGYILDWPDRPFAESAVFDKQVEDTEELYRPSEESQAREFLSVTEEEVHLWAGCGQRPLSEDDSIHYCCPTSIINRLINSKI